MSIRDFLTSKPIPINLEQPISAFLPVQKNIPMENRSSSTKPVLDVNKFINSIAANETGGVRGNKYAFSQPSGSPDLGNALGKYQVTEGELKSYGKRFLGNNVTPQEYLASSTIQDNYMKGKANYYDKQGYHPADIADIHRKGIKKSYPPGSGKYQSPDYVNKFNLNYNQ